MIFDGHETAPPRTRLFSFPSMLPRSPPSPTPLSGFMSGIYSAVSEFGFHFPRLNCTLYRPHRIYSQTGGLGPCYLYHQKGFPPCERCCSGPTCLLVLYGASPAKSQALYWSLLSKRCLLLHPTAPVSHSGVVGLYQLYLHSSLENREARHARVTCRDLSTSHGSDVFGHLRSLPLALSYAQSGISGLRRSLPLALGYARS